jgi:hypothetical protein
MASDAKSKDEVEVVVKGKRTAVQNVRTKELKGRKLLVLIDLDPEKVATEENEGLGGIIWARTEGRTPITVGGVQFKMRLYVSTPKGKAAAAVKVDEDAAEWATVMAELNAK